MNRIHQHRSGGLEPNFAILTLAALALCAGAHAAPRALVPIQETATASSSSEWLECRAATSARSFPDRNASLVASLPAGTVLRVKETSSGARPFHRVEVAGGFEAWVFGRFLVATDEATVYTVAGDRLNMRPLPSNSADAFPLPDRLDRGQKVLVVAQADPGKPFAEDWVRIVAPSDATVWVEASECTPAADPSAAQATFQAARRTLPVAKTTAGGSSAGMTEAPAPVASAPKESAQQPARPVAEQAGARAALKKADDLFDSANLDKGASAETWSAVANAYGEAARLSGAGSSTAAVASRQQERAHLMVELSRLSGELGEREQARQRRIQQLLDTARQYELSQTVLWGRFEGRGYLEMERDSSGQARWYLTWSGERRYEVTSGDGRYDFAMFAGYQLGVEATVRRSYTPPTLETDELLPLLDVRGIEVIIGGRAARKP